MTKNERRELTDERGKYDYCQETLGMENAARMLFIGMGKRLHTIRNEKLHEAGWETWEDYCMEFKDISESSISKMIAVYETFILKYGFKEDELAKAGGWTKLYALSVVIENKADAKRWLSLAKTLSRSDLEKELKEAKTGVDMRKCKHPDTYRYTIVGCRTCKDEWREDDDEGKEEA